MTAIRKNVPQATTDDFLPFTRPSIAPEDIAAVVRVLESGWITSGAGVRELESRICTRVGCRNAVAITSATAGLHLVLHALGVGPGDEVITPSMTWVSTVNLIELCGATPVFVDVDRQHLMTSAEIVERAVTERTRLIIPVHYAGAPLDLDPLRKLAADTGIALVEDSAHALGTEYRGLPVGHSGISILSLQAIKNVTTAEGGVICLDDDDLAERLRRLRFHGLGSDAFDRKSEGRLPSAEVIEPGYKYNLPDMNAVLAFGQLDRLDAMNQRRAALAMRYREHFRAIDEVQPLGIPEYSHTHAWHLYVVRVDVDRIGMSRDEFMYALKARNIGSGLHFRAVHSQAYYRHKYGDALPDLENTNWNSERIVTLPLFPAMNESDVDRVVTAIAEIVTRKK